MPPPARKQAPHAPWVTSARLPAVLPPAGAIHSLVNDGCEPVVGYVTWLTNKLERVQPLNQLLAMPPQALHGARKGWWWRHSWWRCQQHNACMPLKAALPPVSVPLQARRGCRQTSRA